MPYCVGNAENIAKHTTLESYGDPLKENPLL